jgi:proline dehydrogenase
LTESAARLDHIRLSANSMARAAILAAARSPWIERLVTRYGMRLGGSRFVTGEHIEDCVTAIRELNRQGMKANAAVLGEAVTTRDEAVQAAHEYESLVRRLSDERLRANVALKLTLLGLPIDFDLAQNNLEWLLKQSATLGMFVRIDMEESRHVDATLAMYRAMRERGHDNVGAVLQAYLYRSHEDLEALLPLKPNLRIVKGAYLESQNVAYPKKRDVDDNYVSLMERSLLSAGHTAIATHDEAIINRAVSFTQRNGVPRDRFEFQMLYGVLPGLQVRLARQGYDVLVATTYGSHWYPFFMRRLAERPANVMFLLRNLAKA